MSNVTVSSDSVLSRSAGQVQWYAVYTRSRHEQIVKRQLDHKGVEGFLPVYHKISQWKDRRKVIEMPLFPGYLFVHIPLLGRVEVIKSFGVVNLVGDGCTPLPVPEEQILRIRQFVETGLKADPHPYLRIGQKVRILDGPLTGIEGILLRKKNRSRLILSVDLIERSLAVEIDSWKIERI
ncbi:MAG: UpxY family transcription antiterminator [Acidobacteriota bacterium]